MVGPDDKAVEVWRALGQRAVLESERMSDQCLRIKMMCRVVVTTISTEKVRRRWTLRIQKNHMIDLSIVMCSESRKQVEESLER